METTEKLDALKKEVESLNKKLAELTEEELKQVTGGDDVMRYGSLGECNSNYTACDNYQIYQNYEANPRWESCPENQKKIILETLRNGCDLFIESKKGKRRSSYSEITCPLFKLFLQERLL